MISKNKIGRYLIIFYIPCLAQFTCSRNAKSSFIRCSSIWIFQKFVGQIFCRSGFCCEKCFSDLNLMWGLLYCKVQLTRKKILSQGFSTIFRSPYHFLPVILNLFSFTTPFLTVFLNLFSFTVPLLTENIRRHPLNRKTSTLKHPWCWLLIFFFRNIFKCQKKSNIWLHSYDLFTAP